MLREVISNEWFTILIVLCLGVLAFAKFTFAIRFNEYLGVLGNSKYLKIYAREQKFIDQFDSLLFVNLIISLSIFSFIAYNQLGGELLFDILTFGRLMLGIGALLLIKIIFERLIGSLFDIDALIDAYLFQKTNYKNYLGLILLPINVILIYGLTPSKGIIIAVLILLFLINLTGIFATFKNNQKLLLNNIFYFILYLCALEIGPYIIIYKLFN